MGEYSRYFNIEEAKDLLKNPLFSNKYVIFFSGAGNKSRNLFDEKFGCLVNTISLPTYTYNGKQQYVGGINIVIPNLHEQGQIDITMYNIGDNYKKIEQWSNMHYDQNNFSYGYVNDYVTNVKIIELSRTSQSILEHNFIGCTLYTYGGIQLTYDELSAIEVFNVSLQYRSYYLG